MIIEDVKEPVRVRADFSGEGITPRLFERGGRTYRVESVNGRWVDRDGVRPRHCFSVQAGGDTYFLSLKTDDMTWWLEKVILEG